MLLLLAVAACAGPRADGPIVPGLAYRDGFPLGPGEVATWGIIVAQNSTQTTVTLDAIEPVDVDGLDIVSISVHSPDADGAVGQHLGYPPPSAHAVPVAGSALPPEVTGKPSHLEALLVVRKTSDADGRIGHLALRYHTDQSQYELDLPYSLTVFSPRTGSG